MRSVEESYRGSNVRVFKLDNAALVRRLGERARALLEHRPDVIEVRIFGSLARGEGRPGSDADIFVVVRDGAGPFLERSSDLARAFEGAGVGCDVIVYTESEAQAASARHDAFARVVFLEGKVLATRRTST